jgi:fucose 4-O-acetylase-like acetyltransferase
MRKYYLDNIRWITVALVAVYHVIYMYNGVQTYGVIGAFRDVQYQDGVLYLLYPWFMVLLFVASGMTSRYYLEQHSDREFIKSRTGKLLVPGTIGVLIFGCIKFYCRERSYSIWLFPQTSNSFKSGIRVCPR